MTAWSPTPTELVKVARDELAIESYTGKESYLRSLLRRFVALHEADVVHELPKGVKVYTTADGPMGVNRDDAELLGLANRRTQSGGYIVGRSKAEAVMRLDILGYPHYRVNHLRLASGIDMDKLIAVGVITDDGALVLTGDHGDSNVVTVSTDEHGHRYARLVGRLTYPPRREKTFERIIY